MTTPTSARLRSLRPALHRAGVLLSLAGVLTAGDAGAADLRLGLTTSVGLSCQVAGVRVGIQQNALGLYAQGAYCSGTQPGVSFGGGLSYDLFKTGNFTTYALGGFDLLPSGSGAVNLGLGLRYFTPLLPVEGYLEAGVQGSSSLFGTIYGPRVTLGVNYRLNVANLQGSFPPEPPKAADQVIYSGSAPAECKLTPEQDAASARATASGAISSGLSDAASALTAVYSGVSYKITIGGVSIDGNSARVSGSVSVQATQNSNGQRVTGSYGGTVSLVRSDCGWQATGYSRSDQP